MQDRLRGSSAAVVSSLLMSNGTTTVTPIMPSNTGNNNETIFVSWGILWGCYLVATIICLLSIMLRKKVTTPPEYHARGSGDATRFLFYKLLGFALLSRTILLPLGMWLESNCCTTGTSTAHTQTMIMWRLFTETFPELTFSSAWAFLLGFFVHLVATAAGTTSLTTTTSTTTTTTTTSTSTTTTSPTKTYYYNKPLLVHVLGYTTYVILLVVVGHWYPALAWMLVLALLSCIYASLFGTLIYFGPRLLTLLRPKLDSRSGLAIRLLLCCVLCSLVFGARTLSLAYQVMFRVPNNNNDGEENMSLLLVPTTWWWYYYGVVELIPSVALLIMMYPSSSSPKLAVGGYHGKDEPNAATSASTTPTSTPTATNRKGPSYHSMLAIHRVPSGSSGTTTTTKRSNEQDALLTNSFGYGAINNNGSGIHIGN